MKILILRYNPGRTVFEVAEYCRKSLIKLGIATEILDLDHDKIYFKIPFCGRIEYAVTLYKILKRIDLFKPDILLVVKGDRIPGEMMKQIKQEKGVILVNYWLDDPYYISISSKISPFYDYFFTNAASCVEIHLKAGCPHPKFLSFACDPDLHRTVFLISKEHQKYGADICFAGTLDEKRLRTLEHIGNYNLRIHSPRFFYRFEEGYKITRFNVPVTSKVYDKFTGISLWGEELVKAYNASKIVLNIHSPQNTPIMRDFEATGCRAFLLSDYCEGLEKMFVLGEEIACFHTTDELIELIDFYLKNHKKRNSIAYNAQNRCYREHTYEKRMQEMITFISKNHF